MNTEIIHNHNLSLKHSLLAVFLVVCFGANAVAVKLTFQGIGVFSSAGIRFGLASIVILLWALFTRRRIKLKPGQFRQLFLFTMVFLVQLSLIYKGLSKTDASRATLISNLQPFFLLILAHFFVPGDRFTLKKITGLTMGLIGLLIVFGDSKLTSNVLYQGDLMVLIGTFMWAASIVYLKRIIVNYEPFQIVLYQMLIAFPLFLVEGYFFDTQMVFKIDWIVVSSLLYQAVVTASFGFITWSGLLKRYGAVALHSYLFIMPIAGVIFSWLILNEKITDNIVIAMLCITAGIIIVNYKGKNPFYPLRRSGV